MAPLEIARQRLAQLGIILRPEWGALVMSASTVIVAVNALLLRRVELGAV